MDIETAGAIESVRGDIGRVEASVVRIDPCTPQ